MSISSSGKVGKTREETIHSLMPSIGIIHKPTETLELVIHLANHEDYETGIKAPILLGSKQSILRDFYFHLFSDIFLIGSLFTMGAYYLVLYFLRRRELQIWLFFLICFIFILRTAAVNEKTLLVLFPNLSLAIHKKINYSSHFIALTLVFHFVLNFIESRNLKKWIWFNHIFSGVCILAVITLPLFYASQLLNVFKIQSLITLFFLLYQFLKYYQETKRYRFFLLFGISSLTVL